MRRAVASAVGVCILWAGVARADSGWREIQGPHVTLRTDLSSGAAKEAAAAVERFRSELIIAGAWPRATLPAADRIEVTVFANGLDFEHHFGRNVGGIFFHELPPYAILYGTPDRWERRASAATAETTSVLRHELVHHLAASIYRRQPRWFAEGLAQFLETVRASDDGKSVIVGAVNLEAVRKYHTFRTVRVADALSWNAKLDTMPEGTVHGLYGLSWVMVHWMYNAHPAQFDQLQGLLARGVDPEKAWKIILPGLNTPDIDDALHQYVKHGDYTEFLAPFTPQAPALKETALGEADAHAERARVSLAAARHSSDPIPAPRGGEARAGPGPRARPDQCQRAPHAGPGRASRAARRPGPDADRGPPGGRPRLGPARRRAQGPARRPRSARRRSARPSRCARTTRPR